MRLAFMKRRTSMSSLSHSITCRSFIAAGSIGTRSSRRSRVRTKPPGCWERWRGVPISWRARAQAGERLDDQREAIGQVVAGPAVQPHAGIVLARDDPEAVVLDLVQP